MSILNQINDDISRLQTRIPEDLFRIKEQISKIVLSETEVKNHPFVIGLLDKNRSLRKKIHKLEKQLLDVLLTGVKSKKEIIVIDDDFQTPPTPASTPLAAIHSKKPVEIKTEKPVEIKKENITIIIEDDAAEEEEEEEDDDEIKESTSFSYPYPRDRVEPEYPPKKQEVIKEKVVEEEVEEVEEVVEEEVEEVEVEEEEVEEVEVEETGTGVVQGAVAPAEEVEEVEEEEVEETGAIQGAPVGISNTPAEEVEETGVVQGAVAPAEEEEEESVYEVTLKGKTYYVMNEIDSVIYDVDENGDVSLEVGIYKEGKPTFYKKK